MGELCIIVNHSKRMYLHPIMKFRELLLNHYGDYLIHLLEKTDIPLKDMWYSWSGNDIEVVSERDMKKYESILTDYKDMTKQVENLFEDAVGVNA